MRDGPFGGKDDAGSSELLRHRAHVKDRRRCERDGEFQARATEGLFVNELPSADYAD